MALKAGRVGVAPDQVDDFGVIKSETTSGYTKQEADAKFETKTDAVAALAEKQPIRLDLPISFLGGSLLTVPDALHSIADSINGTEISFSSVEGTVSVNSIKKYGKFVVADLRTNGVTISAWAPIAVLPAGYRPASNYRDVGVNTADGSFIQFSVNSNGDVVSTVGINNKEISLHLIFSI